MAKDWYVIHTYSGYENKVKMNLEKRVESMNMEEKIFRVLVPMEDEIEFKNGKEKITKRKVYPGYVLVEMEMTDDSWYVVRNTPGVTGFVGTGTKPIPLLDQEVVKILQQMGMDEVTRGLILRLIRVSRSLLDRLRILWEWFAKFLQTKANYELRCLCLEERRRSNWSSHRFKSSIR